MKKEDLSQLRLQAQQLSEPDFTKPETLVAYMGAMQAQDYPMSRWAIGARLENTTVENIKQAIDSGTIIRTHVMRPTWHYVAAEDLRWMLELTAPRIRATMKSRAVQLNITPEILKQHRQLLEKELAQGPLNRDAIIEIYKKNKIETGNNRASHLLMYAELDGLICSGPDVNGKQSYALVEKHVAKPKGKHPQDPAVALAQRYFESHGPATLADFSWWSGLSPAVCRKAAENLGKDFESTEIEGKVYFYQKHTRASKARHAILLPSYDEFLISYKDRSASLEDVHNKKVISNNGIFNPLLVFDGQVKGTWKRVIKNGEIHFTATPFEKLTSDETAAIGNEMERFAAFLGSKAVIDL